MNKRLLLLIPFVALGLSMCDDGETDARERAKQIDGRLEELGCEAIGTIGDSFIGGVRIGIGDIPGGINQMKDAWDRSDIIQAEASKLNTEREGIREKYGF